MTRAFDHPEHAEMGSPPDDGFSLPSLDLLDAAARVGIDRAELERTARLLESVLGDFHVKGAIVFVRPGPAVTTYEFEPAAGTQLKRVIALTNDIARHVAAVSARVAAIPGRTAIGIELANATRDAVGLHELIGSQAFEDDSGALPVVLGKSTVGDPVIADLAQMPHLLVAGTTGSGKSVGLNCMILSLLYRLTPERCRLILIDPKMLELRLYDGIPHLLTPVVTDPSKAVRALEWAVEQMEERYRTMSSVADHNVADSNDGVCSGHFEAQSDSSNYPLIVIIIDELAELMMANSASVEFAIRRLVKRGGDAGIHLVLSTDRPSADIVTDAIKASLKHRISYSVITEMESRIALGEAGAELLNSSGDMLYRVSGEAAVRVHGAMVSDDEVRAVADYWRSQAPPDYMSSYLKNAQDDLPPAGESVEDIQYRAVIQLVVESQKASTSWLQRKLRIGYDASARLIERMEKDGIVGRPDQVGRRSVLRDREGNPQQPQLTPIENRGCLLRLFGL